MPVGGIQDIQVSAHCPVVGPVECITASRRKGLTGRLILNKGLAISKGPLSQWPDNKWRLRPGRQ